jgi:hypothetical protein
VSWSRTWAVLSLFGVESLLSAKGEAQATGASPQLGTLTVFLDCDACDDDYVRTEIAYVNWVRDRTVADVHILVTEQDMAAGGDAFTLAFIGQRTFAGRSDTLTFNTNPTTTDDEERRGLTRTLALGLVPFVARTSGALSLRITRPEVSTTAPGAQTVPARDPWKAWVFEIDASADIGGEQSYRNREFDGEFSANRTTLEWKLELESRYSYEYERFIDYVFDTLGVVTDVDTTYNRQRSWGAEMVLVKSLTNHWSTGVVGSIGAETFRNQDFRFQVTPAIEYNVFNYSEATRRYLAFQVGVGFDAFAYVDTTIFDKMQEAFPLSITATEYATRQPWGQSNVRLEHRVYLNDRSKSSTVLSGDMNVRIFRGFSVRFGGQYSWIHDQVYLAKGERTSTDVLLRRQALLTGYEYNAFFGFTYTFGSIFNNVVNPRFF